MSIINNGILLASEAAAAGGEGISRSLRFNSADSAYLSRTPASAGNRKTWTWAGWVKRSGTSRDVLFARFSGSSGFAFEIDSFSRLWAYDYTTSAFDWQLISTPVYRDPSAWYHIVFAYDTTQATASNRVKLYINGAQVTTFSTETYPTQNFDGYVNTTSTHEIGGAFTVYFDGLLADIHFIDGQALDPTSFGEFDANGIWQPIAYTGTYGTNGFKLTFGDNSTTAALGNDDSPNSNTWAVNNFSVAAGAGNDSLVDVPTNGAETDTGAGGEVRGNYCTLNPLKYGGDIQAPTNGNLDVTSVGSATGKILGTIGVSSGKWYWECVPNSSANIAFGITKDNTVLANYPGQDAVDYSYHSDGSKYSNNSGSAYGATFTTNDVIGVAFDADNGTLTFYKNNSSQGQAYSGLTSGPYFPMVGDPSSTPDISATVNFGQRPFAYTAPSGFKALNTANLPAPVVTKPSDLFDVKLYTGNGGTQTISGLGFSPDFVWMKRRDSAASNALYDIVRGVKKYLNSDGTGSEYEPASGGVTAFNSDGFTIVEQGGVQINASSASMVAWAWDAGSSTVTNTQGSISSQVRANASAGFSVVTYTGTGATATVGHGLGVAPSLILCKSRTTTVQWVVYHASLGKDQFLGLNTTDAAIGSSSYWGSGVTSTVFGLQNLAGGNNNGNLVAYCFAPVDGYSSMGSFVANANNDGPFIYTSFKPRFVLCKLSSASGADWLIFDTARSPYNVVQANLRPNTSGAEESAFARIDILSNGFKVRAGSGVEPNGTNGNTYIYAAWAESPFNYSRAA
jgi:hypothetical protein